MRKRYIQDPETLELIEADKFYAPSVNAPMVMGDIAPYRSMVTGEIITSRSRHREHLRDHNCIEVGNETKYIQPRPMTPPPGLKQTLIEVAHQKFRS